MDDERYEERDLEQDDDLDTFENAEDEESF